MNLDELMAVWKSQDAAPLHDVNRNLLQQALRADEAKLQKERRRERWIIYVFSTGVVAAMALFLAMMIAARDRKVMTAWDFVIGIGGAAAALLTGGAMYVNHKGQTRSEQRFGESLRDQLNRRIAQLDYSATRGLQTSLLVMVLMGVICPMAIVLLGYRINQKSLLEDGSISPAILGCIWLVVMGVWEVRRQARGVLPRKRRLEALLKDLDSQ